VTSADITLMLLTTRLQSNDVYTCCKCGNTQTCRRAYTPLTSLLKHKEHKYPWNLVWMRNRVPARGSDHVPRLTPSFPDNKSSLQHDVSNSLSSRLLWLDLCVETERSKLVTRKNCTLPPQHKLGCARYNTGLSGSHANHINIFTY
jgi:hypothetical protein